MNNPHSDKFIIFQKVLKFAQNRAHLVLLIFTILFAVAGWGLKFSKLELDIYDVFDPNFQSSIDLADMKEFYSDRTQMLVQFEFAETPHAGEICKIIKWSKSINNYREVKNITSIWSLRNPKSANEKLWYPKSLTEPCDLDPTTPYVIKDHFSQSFFRHLISRTGSQDLVFDITFSGDSSSMVQVQYVIDETNKFLAKDLGKVKAHFLGLAGSRYYFKKIMFEDGIYNILVVLIIFIFMRLIYGTWISGWYLILTLIGSTLILYGTLALTGIPINILTNNLFLMTAVAGTADFIFVTQSQMKRNYQESFQKLITPCFFTTLTTVIGFLSLNTSDLTLIKQFGNGAALGSMAEWIMLFIFLPALLKVLNKEKVWVNPDKAISVKWFDKIENLSLPPKALPLFGILMVLSVPAFFFLNDYDSPIENLPKNHILRSGYESFKNKFSWQGQVYLYFPEKLPLTDQQRILTSIQKSKLIYRIENPQDLVEEWTKGLPPLRQDLIQRELGMTPLWRRYYSNFDQVRIPLYLYEQDLHTLRALRDFVQKICHSNCRLAGQRVVYLEYGEKISKTMIESFAVSIFLVICILGWLLKVEGKFQHFWPVTLSSLMGPLTTLTLIALFQVPVTLITSIFLAIMVGLAGDNAIQYLLAEGDLNAGIDDRARGSLMVTLVMILGSSMFILQTLLPMKILGCLFIFGFFINLLGDLWGLKGLLTKKS